MTEERDRPDAGPTGQPPAEPPPEAPEREGRRRPRRLTRSRRDRLLGGVAGGLAEYTDLDPALMRLLIVIVTLLTGGFLILVYIAAWIVMPEAPEGSANASEPTEPPPDTGHMATLAIGLVLILIGVWALLAALDVPAPPWDVILSVLLILAGLAIVASARGGLHGGLFVVAIILTGLLALGSAVNIGADWESGFGERTVRPLTMDEVESSYSHGFGSMIVDLSNVEFTDETRIELDIAFGDLDVRLPSGIEYRVDGSTVFGNTEVDGREFSGIASDHDFRTSGYDNAPRRLDLDISTVFGSTTVRR